MELNKWKKRKTADCAVPFGKTIGKHIKVNLNANVGKAEGAHREHLKQLQAVQGPALFGLVDGEGQLHVACVLREQQHQEDGSRKREVTWVSVSRKTRQGERILYHPCLLKNFTDGTLPCVAPTPFPSHPWLHSPSGIQ